MSGTADGASDTLVLIGLGSNLGDRRAHLNAAIEALEADPDLDVVARGPVIETPPVGPPGQGPYLNSALALRTALPPRAVLDRLAAIERSRGRDRAREPRWGPRTLDLDLLLHGARRIAEPDLEVPHPRMHERTFVLEPLAAIAPDALHPGLGRTVRELLDALSDAGAAT